MAGLGGDAQGSVEREGEGAEGVKGGQKGGEDSAVVEPLVGGAAGGELRVAPGFEWIGCGRGGVMFVGSRGTAAGDFVLNGVDFVVNGAEDSVFAPEAGEGEDAGEGEAADEERGMCVRHEAT